MKDAIDSMPAERPVEQEAFANRKLIRPALNRNDHNHMNHANHPNHVQVPMERRDRPEYDQLGQRACSARAEAVHLYSVGRGW